MRKTNLLVTIFLVVLVFAVIGLSPWIAGFIFKENYLNLIEIINRDNRVKVDVLEYHSGWFNSHAKIQVTPIHFPLVKSEQNPIIPPSFTIEHTIAHGPLVFDKIKNGYTIACASIQSFVHLPPPIEARILGNQSTQGLVQINSLATFGGDWFNNIRMPLLNIPTSSFSKMIWQGLTSDFNFSVFGDFIQKVDLKMQVGSLAVEGDNQSPISAMTIQSISYENNATRQPIGLWNGAANVSVPTVSVKESDGSSVVVDSLAGSSSFGISGDTYHLDSQLSIKSILTPNFLITNISPAKIALAIKGINAQALVEFMQTVRSRGSKPFTPGDLQNYVNKLAHLITPTSSITEEVALNTSSGNMQGKIKLYWTPNAPAPTTLQDIMLNTNMASNIRIAIPLVDKFIEIFSEKYPSAQLPAPQVANPQAAQLPVQTPEQTKADRVKQMINAWEQQGYIIKDNNDYVMSITREGGIIKINGKVMSPPVAPSSQPDTNAQPIPITPSA
jgi:uncharacterized protein YdgA (DUF945 family)